MAASLASLRCCLSLSVANYGAASTAQPEKRARRPQWGVIGNMPVRRPSPTGLHYNWLNCLCGEFFLCLCYCRCSVVTGMLSWRSSNAKPIFLTWAVGLPPDWDRAMKTLSCISVEVPENLQWHPRVPEPWSWRWCPSMCGRCDDARPMCLCGRAAAEGRCPSEGGTVLHRVTATGLWSIRQVTVLLLARGTTVEDWKETGTEAWPDVWQPGFNEEKSTAMSVSPLDTAQLYIIIILLLYKDNMWK